MADGKLGKAVMENEISHCDEHNQNLSIPQSNTTKLRKRKVKKAGDASILEDASASASIKMKKKSKTTLTADGSERAAEVLIAVKSPAKVRPSSRVQSTKSATPLPPAPELPEAADGDGVNLDPSRSNSVTPLPVAADADVGSPTRSEKLGTGSSLQPEKECPPADVITVDVERYKVKPELSDTAQYILNKYGDVVSVTSLKGSLLTYMLENVCQIYQKLEKSELMDLTNAELEAMRIELLDLQNMNVNVSWLLTRLEDIQNANKVLQTLDQELTEAKERFKRFLEKSLVDGV
ncbi:unnamed protein product [Rhodiola kirilowii]